MNSSRNACELQQHQPDIDRLSKQKQYEASHKFIKESYWVMYECVNE
jgi:hypothetical protein